jgi:hypothetical protein
MDVDDYGAKEGMLTNEPNLMGLCIQGILVINKISNLEILKD